MRAKVRVDTLLSFPYSYKLAHTIRSVKYFFLFLFSFIPAVKAYIFFNISVFSFLRLVCCFHFYYNINVTIQYGVKRL